MRVFLDSIGCRLNQSEIEQIARELLAAGHGLAASAAEADTVIINTCAVTREATRDARNRTRRYHREPGEREIVLTGCYATVAPGELARVTGADRVVSNQDKGRLVQLLDPGAIEVGPVFDQEPLLRNFLATQMGNTRAFVKVQDGCDNRCTFCITTVARGAGQSRPLGDVVREVQALSTAGYQEAVLTGVHLGSYGHDLGRSQGLAELVTAILQHTDIRRLRLSSLEPWDIDENFFSLWENARLLPHLHLPLQSGSDRILRLMARRTRRDDFRALVRAARAQIPDLNLSTDLIAGFPGESEEDFAATRDFVAELAFSRLHVFTYSARPGTAAASMPAQLPKQVRKARARELISHGDALSQAFHRRYEGMTRPVLWEAMSGADEKGICWTGYTDNYIRVRASGPVNLFNQVTPVLLSDAGPEGMQGEVSLEAAVS